MNLNGTILKYTGYSIVISNEVSIIHYEIILYPSYPNPFNGSSKIMFDITIAGLDPVTLKVLDTRGREIEMLMYKHLQKGRYEVYFDGSKLSIGVYYYSLLTGDYRKTGKMVFLK